MSDEASDEASRRYLREGGRMTLDDGSRLVWSMAEGRRGRRWRTVTTRDGALVGALLLEVGLDGRPTRLELATAGALLTLHPEPDERAIHGNVVSTDGVRPLACAWSRGHELEVAGQPIPIALAIHRRRPALAIGEAALVPAVVIDPALIVEVAELRIVRTGGDDWSVEVPARRTARTVSVDGDGLPVSEERWPLEP